MPKSRHEAILAHQLERAGLDGFEREFKFHPDRRWRFDFANSDLMLAVEVEGGIWSRGRHTRGRGFIDDCEKYNEAALLGWRVLRIPTDWIGENKTVGVLIVGQAIKTLLERDGR